MAGLLARGSNALGSGLPNGITVSGVFESPARRLQLRGQLWLCGCFHAPHSLFIFQRSANWKIPSRCQAKDVHDWRSIGKAVFSL